MLDIKTYKLADIEIWDRDLYFLDSYNIPWQSGKKLLDDLKGRWRIPNPEEMIFILRFRPFGVFNLTREKYWTSETSDKKHYRFIEDNNRNLEFSGSWPKQSTLRIRPVRWIL